MASEEQVILKAFIESREDFDKFGPYILALKNMDRNMKQMLWFIRAFYEKYSKAVTISESEMKMFIKTRDPMNFGQNNANYIKSIFQTDIKNRDLTMDVIEHALEKHFMAEIVDVAAGVLQNNKSGQLLKVTEIIDKFHSIIRQPPDDIQEYKLDLKDLIKTEIATKGIPFSTKTPNDIIRGMRPGQLGLIYAYVDTGKTSYGVNNLCAVAKYLQDKGSKRPVVYGCNEEDVSRVSLRAIQCITNWEDNEIKKNEPLVAQIIKKRGFGNIRFIDHITSMKKVEKLLIRYNPKVLFIDQGTKVSILGTKKEGVNALEEVFNTLRDLAKRYDCTIICMAQGGDDCAGKKHPQLRDIYGSKSAVQGELDWAISIGVDNTDDNYSGWRFFAITKNKGDKGTYACRFDHKRCQFTEVV